MPKEDELAEFAKTYGNGNRVKCSIQTLPDSLLALIEANPGVSHASVSAWLKTKHSISLSADIISRHRRGICRCERMS